MKMATKYDYLIVGAGLTGSVVARELTDAGKRCLVVDKRSHVGGNVYDQEIEGVRVHRYGPHIFHTNSERIWEYVNRYSKWTPYEHRVKARFGGKTYSFPPNLLTYEQLEIKPDDPSLPQVLFDTFFRGYSAKQWGRPADEVPVGIIKRIPIRYDYDDRYFSDRFQGLPADGYTALIDNLLSGVAIETDVDYLVHKRDLDRVAERTIYTGPVDALFGYDMGRLEYRSLRFETETVGGESYQGAASINYTDLFPSYTRVHEWRFFGWQKAKTCIITREYPETHNETNEPYYPVNDERNNALYRVYRERAEADGYIVAGRLGKYCYYDMHQAIGAALRLTEDLLC